MRYLIFKWRSHIGIYERKRNNYKIIYKNHTGIISAIGHENANAWVKLNPHIYTFTNNIDKYMTKYL